MSEPSPKSTIQPDKRKPDLGLYQTKHLLRKVLRKFPGVSKLSPNLLSIAALAPGLLAAVFIMVGCVLALCKVPVWPTLVPLMCASCALTIGLGIFRSIREIRHLDGQERTNVPQQPQASP
jgi:hypothetical protein